MTDTVDAVYPPDNWCPEAMMDQLAEIVSELPVTETKVIVATAVQFMRLIVVQVTHAETATKSSIYDVPDIVHEASAFKRHMRSPSLKSVKQIDSIRDLAPFFSQISILSYESVYASGGLVDWDAVNRSVMDDLFDGR